MKKLLSLLASFGLALSATVSVTACITKNNSKDISNFKSDDLNGIIKEFKEEVIKIYNNHIKNEVSQNFIGLPETEKNYLFIKKENIIAYSNKEQEITLENKKQIENDENIILRSKLLEEKLNELKKVNKYKVILDEVFSIYDGIEIIYNDNFKIKSGELSQGLYIGNFINEYKINIKYKSTIGIQKFELRDTLKYTSTESKIFKDSGDNFVKNIEKDFLTLNKMKKYSNFKWNDIKDNKNSYEGYGEFSKEIKKYINTSDEYKNNLINLINFIKSNYFKSFNNLNIKFNQNNIYIDSVFKSNLLNVFENKSAKSFENYTNSEKVSEKIFKTIFRNDPNTELNKESLKELYFTNNNMEKWSSDLLVLKNNYLKNLKLSEELANSIQKSTEFINADSIGSIKIKGATIAIGLGNDEYIHELSDFNLSVTYNVSSKKEEKINFLSEFTSKVLIKGLHYFYGIDSSFKYPQYNSDEDYLMNIGNKQIAKIILEKLEIPNPHLGETGSLSSLFWSLWSRINIAESIKYFNSIKIINMLKNNFKNSIFIFPNYLNDLQNYNKSNDGINFNNKIGMSFNEEDVSFIPAKDGTKVRNPDSITVKLGYLTVNFKYEKLFNLSENQESKIFIKFI
ncbi:hypothetical protein [Spiroplasma endosymbiont of Atherix ibis]|uniref:hypothetical protein n=1 Tax=Spiroplasma endosymbiont of Atherix ibis TaxID=3066291 RepID=UPI0030CB4443